MLGAIIIADCGEAVATDARRSLGRMPWACTDLLGQSVIARLVDQFKRESCDAVFVTGGNPTSKSAAGTSSDRRTDSWESASTLLASLRAEGFETVLIARCGAYVEFNSAEMLAFHRERGAWLSRAAGNDGLLDLWMIDCSCVSEGAELLPLLDAEEPAIFQVYGYVNRLQNAYDYRRLVLDSFSSRCRLRPHGSEVKPGVWISERAQIERTSRLVAPAFIGRDVLISDDCLITRGSNIERNSHVDFGSAVEDSSILANSYVGIGLDLSHSIVDGSDLLNLRHNVSLKITDPVVMRQNNGRDEGDSWADAQSEMAFSSLE